VEFHYPLSLNLYGCAFSIKKLEESVETPFTLWASGACDPCVYLRMAGAQREQEGSLSTVYGTLRRRHDTYVYQSHVCCAQAVSTHTTAPAPQRSRCQSGSAFPTGHEWTHAMHNAMFVGPTSREHATSGRPAGSCRDGRCRYGRRRWGRRCGVGRRRVGRCAGGRRRILLGAGRGRLEG
jgi:hypothetical protein